jgi:hypothetical protein
MVGCELQAGKILHNGWEVRRWVGEPFLGPLLGAVLYHLSYFPKFLELFSF